MSGARLAPTCTRGEIPRWWKYRARLRRSPLVPPASTGHASLTPLTPGAVSGASSVKEETTTCALYFAQEPFVQSCWTGPVHPILRPEEPTAAGPRTIFTEKVEDIEFRLTASVECSP